MKSFKINQNEHKSITISENGEYLVELLGEGAEVEIKGAFQTDGKEQLKVVINVVHKAGHTRANTTLRGVARGESSIKFVGRIIIEENCPVVNSFLTEKVLLLSDKARAEAVPELEIESDDVKCSHAATVSNIPEEELFYLMSRGVSRVNAEEMIVEGFLEV
jgi:Fe-S cluster assembly scaffold protein SufB